MAIPCPTLQNGSRLVVGSAANAADLATATAETASECCDLVEIRLDLLEDTANRPWQHLSSLPLLFTARRAEEGGAGDLPASQRMSLIHDVIGEASLIDIEVASILEMPSLLEELLQHDLPWVASFHDFDKLPDTTVMEEAAAMALEAGAAAFKVAAQLAGPEDLARLVEFQEADHGLPVASMGMGPLAPVSRVQCAHAGSTLNYGFLGDTATAPGQWSAAQLKQAIDDLDDLADK